MNGAENLKEIMEDGPDGLVSVSVETTDLVPTPHKASVKHRSEKEKQQRFSMIQKELEKRASTVHPHSNAMASTKRFSTILIEADNTAEGGVVQKYIEQGRDDILLSVNTNKAGRRGSVNTESIVSGRKFELTIRDLHILDPNINLHGPCFEVRKGSILINLDPIKAIITSTKVIVFLPSVEESESETKVKFNIMNKKSMGGKNLEIATQLARKKSFAAGNFKGELCSDETILPQHVGGTEYLRKLVAVELKEKINDIIGARERNYFEIIALESLLVSFCDFINHEFEELKPTVLEVCEQASTERNTEVELVELLRRCKSTLGAFKVKIEDSISAFDEILKDVDGLNLMQLTKYAKQPGRFKPGDSFIEYEEVEALFDTCLQALEVSLSNVEILLHDVDAVYELLMFNLDHGRNQLLRVEIVFSAMTTTASISAVIVGGFGMNLKSDAEELPHYFWGILSGAFIFVPLGSLVILIYLWRIGVFGALST